MQEAMESSTVAPVGYYIARKEVKMERLSRDNSSNLLPVQGPRRVLLLEGWTGKRGLDL